MWMRERLRRSGLRAISPVVDVTNYVLLELGQPMHGFDLGQARRRDPGAPGASGRAPRPAQWRGARRCAPDTLVIADAERAVALAGIMGGAATGVGADTRDILLESAFFAPIAISGKARSYGLHTDSSHRFERGVDPELQVRAIERATRLLLDIVGGEPGPVVEATVGGASAVPRATASARRAHYPQILGSNCRAETIEDILERLGMTLERREDGWQVTPPSARFDLVQEVDLIADIGRIHGYDLIPVSHASSASVTKSDAETGFDLDRARLALVDRGFQEVITYSFVSPEMQGAGRARRRPPCNWRIRSVPSCPSCAPVSGRGCCKPPATIGRVRWSGSGSSRPACAFGWKPMA